MNWQKMYLVMIKQRFWIKSPPPLPLSRFLFLLLFPCPWGALLAFKYFSSGTMMVQLSSWVYSYNFKRRYPLHLSVQGSKYIWNSSSRIDLPYLDLKLLSAVAFILSTLQDSTFGCSSTGQLLITSPRTDTTRSIIDQEVWHLLRLSF